MLPTMGVKSPPKRFNCQAKGCGKSFNRRDYLIRHEANHSDEKPFCCVQCQIGFSRKDILEKHYRSQSHQDRRVQLTNKHRTFRFKNIKIQGNEYELPDNTKPSAIEPQSTKHLSIASANKADNLFDRSEGSNNQYLTIGTKGVEGHNESRLFNDSDTNGLTNGFVGDEANGFTSGDGLINGITLDNNLDWLFGEDFELHEKYVSKEQANEHEVLKLEQPKGQIKLGIQNKNLHQETIIRLGNIFQSMRVEMIPMKHFNNYLLNFWVYFNSIYPIIHQPTFDPNGCNIWLLIAMLSIGMTFSNNKNDYEHSVNIHKGLRLNLFSEIGDSPEIDLELLQAILLENFYGTLMSTPNQIKISHIFHGTSINLLKYSGYFLNLKEPEIDIDSGKSLLPQQKDIIWKEWIHFETCKRIAFFGFILDAQHASLFRHSQLLSIFEIRLELPCTDSLWNSLNGSCFLYEYERQPNELKSRAVPDWTVNDNSETNNPKKSYSKPSMLHIEMEGKWPSLLWSLRRLMQPYKKAQKEYAHNCFSQFSRMILLHGVLSITWDLKCRSLLDLGFVSKRSLSALIDRLNLALTNWKGYFETQIKYTNLAAFEGKDQIVLNNYDVSNIFWNSITLYQFSSIVLNVDLSLIFDITSEFINENSDSLNNANTMGSRNKQKVQTWVRSDDSKNAIIGSCKILYTTINNPDIINVIPHSIWVLYISCLTIWVYENNIEIKLSNGNTPVSNLSIRSYYHADNDAVIDFQNINYSLAKDTVDGYIMSVLDASDDVGTPKNKSVEDYWKAQRETMGLLVLVFYILKKSKWKSATEMLTCLEKLLVIYK